VTPRGPRAREEIPSRRRIDRSASRRCVAPPSDTSEASPVVAPCSARAAAARLGPGIPSRALSAATLLALAAAAPVGAWGAEPLEVDFARDGAVVLVAGGLAGALGLFADPLTPDACRLCEPGRLDAGVRDGLRWDRPERARIASDVLANGVLPGAVVLHAAVAAWGDGGSAQAAEDLLVVSEALLLAVDLNQVVKGATGRLRPAAWAEGRTVGTDVNRSFYSGHTSLAFSLASAAGTVATLRRYRSAPWVWAVGMSLAAGVGYLRVAGDAHWLTDVLAGAVIGGGVGFAVPWTLHRRRGGRAPAVQLFPAPGGFALAW
jgi:membrane-associated phospholipid phosphatase